MTQMGLGVYFRIGGPFKSWSEGCGLVSVSVQFPLRVLGCHQDVLMTSSSLYLTHLNQEGLGLFQTGVCAASVWEGVPHHLDICVMPDLKLAKSKAVYSIIILNMYLVNIKTIIQTNL